MGQPFGGAPLAPQNDDASTYQGDQPVGEPEPVNWWEAEGVPAGAHHESLYVRDETGAKHFAPPTHYHHLADGRVVAGYSGGTLYSEPGPNGKGERITRIIGSYAG